MFIRRGFSENYETVGKDCFTHNSFVKELKKDERASDELMAQNSVIRFNSEWLCCTKILKCKAPLIEPNLRRNLGKWST